MRIWTSEVLIALIACLLLSACDEVAGTFGGSQAGQPFTATRLVGDSVTLVAPRGYCIEKRSVRRGTRSAFALIARCDTLGAGGYFDSDDLALITVTVESTNLSTQPDMQDVELSLQPAKPTRSRTISGIPFVRVTDTRHSVDGASARVWRSAFLVNGNMVALALYAEDGSAMLGDDGARLLADLARRTQQASTAAESPAG